MASFSFTAVDSTKVLPGLLIPQASHIADIRSRDPSSRQSSGQRSSSGKQSAQRASSPRRSQSPRSQQRPQSPRSQSPRREKSPRSQAPAPQAPARPQSPRRQKSPRAARPNSPRRKPLSGCGDNGAATAGKVATSKGGTPREATKTSTADGQKVSTPLGAVAEPLEICEVETDPIVMLATERAQQLTDASAFGSIEVVSELCRSPRAHMYLDQKVGEREMTALMCAAQAGNADAARVLLENGADPNICDAHGRSALMLAASNGEPSLFSPLLDHGADGRLRAANGWTALMFACSSGHTELAGQLLEAVEGQSSSASMQLQMHIQSAIGVAREEARLETMAFLEALLEQEEGLDVDAAMRYAKEPRE